MRTSEQGIELIKEFEGCKLTAYRCLAGKWTIGYGHTGNDVHEGMIINQEQAESLLRRDVLRFERCVTQAVGVAMSQGQMDALVSFAFNLGCEALRGSTLLRKMNRGDYFGASEEFLKWVYAGGKALEGLARRRKAEKERFLAG